MINYILDNNNKYIYISIDYESKNQHNQTSNNKIQKYNETFSLKQNIKIIERETDLIIDDTIIRYIACFVLGIIGNKIGFTNGFIVHTSSDEKIQLNRSILENEIFIKIIILMNSFIFNGGMTNFNLEHFTYSHDIILLLYNLIKLTNKYDNINELIKNTFNKYTDIFKNDKILFDKYSSINIDQSNKKNIENINKIKSSILWKKNNYNYKDNKSIGITRSIVYGLAFHSSSNLDKLIKTSIDTCAITNINGIAFLGSFTIALFTSYAIQNINCYKWGFELLTILNTKNNPVDSYILQNYNNIYEFYLKDKAIFVDKFSSYLEDNFINYEYLFEAPKNNDNLTRSLYYYENFSNNKKIYNPGACIDESIIIAYDTFLLSQNNFEKLIYSLLIIGETSIISIIACNFYGAYFGFNNVISNFIMPNSSNDNLINNILENNNIIDIIYLFFKKYYNNK